MEGGQKLPKKKKMQREWFNKAPLLSFNHYQLMAYPVSSIPPPCHPTTTLMLDYLKSKSQILFLLQIFSIFSVIFSSIFPKDDSF